MKKETKKIMAVLMLLLVLINSLPLNAFAAFITDINSNAEFGVVGGSFAEYKHELHYANYDGGTYLLFCTQFGKKSPNGKAYEYGNEFLAEFKANRPEYQHMAEMIYFGYTMNYGMGLPGSYEEIRNILGFDIDHLFLTYKKELLEYGYEVTKISIKEKYVLIHKIESGI